MKDIVELVRSLGNLHDAKILEFAWRRLERTLEMGVHDLYIDLEGLPDYPGPTKARFIFSEVSKLDLEADLADSSSIYDWIFKQQGPSKYISELQISPSGRLIVECSDIKCITDDSVK